MRRDPLPTKVTDESFAVVSIYSREYLLPRALLSKDDLFAVAVDNYFAAFSK